jgi:predicted nuclease with TOPRIM domain
MSQMEGEGFLRVFMEMAKKAQENRDSQKIKELEEALSAMAEKHQQLQNEYKLMRNNYEE